MGTDSGGDLGLEEVSILSETSDLKVEWGIVSPYWDGFVFTFDGNGINYTKETAIRDRNLHKINGLNVGVNYRLATPWKPWEGNDLG